MVDHFTDFIKAKISNIQNQMQTFLENNQNESLHKNQIRTAKFETTSDAKLIRGISVSLPKEHLQKIVVVFSRLSQFFDSGILLENHDGEWIPQSFFHKGIVEVVYDSPVKIKIPHKPLLEILKTNSNHFLQKVHMNHLDQEGKYTCLVIRVTPDFSIALFSNLADMWLVNHIKMVKQELQNCFAEF